MVTIWVVVWLTSILYFPMTIGFIIIPIDELIFFRGVAQPPTSHGGSPNELTGWFMMVVWKNAMKIDDDWGYPHFRKPPYVIIYPVVRRELRSDWGIHIP